MLTQIEEKATFGLDRALFLWLPLLAYYVFIPSMEAVVGKEKLYYRIARPMGFWLPLFAYCALIFLLSSSSKPLLMGSLFWGGKVLHMAEYAILGVLAARAIFSLDLRSSDGFVFALSVIFCVLYGLSDEIHQSFTPGRSTDLGDLMADGLGALIGTLLYWKLIIAKKSAT